MSLAECWIMNMKIKDRQVNAVSTSNIDILYDKGIKAGALGGKLLGAGGRLAS